MNRTSRTDEPLVGDGYNQNPNDLSNDLTTNQDLNGIVNSRALRRSDELSVHSPGNHIATEPEANISVLEGAEEAAVRPQADDVSLQSAPTQAVAGRGSRGVNGLPVLCWGRRFHRRAQSFSNNMKSCVIKFSKFIGPGSIIAVAYIDPGNFATDIAAGASYQFRLLFIVLLSNVFAIFLQSLSIKLGTVSGLNLAEACRAFLPRWMNYSLYVLAEIAIIATDIAEVIGTAIALNLLIPALPLVGGCAVAVLDVMIILFFYRPSGSMRGLRAFEFLVVLLVLGVVICFCIQLSLIRDTSVGEIFQGYLPSSAVVQQQGLYQACGILGATVMPHSLYLGSGIVQSRLREYDSKSGLLPPTSSASETEDAQSTKSTYIPSLAAIRYSMNYSIAELVLSLATFALFVNSAILIVAGASLYNNSSALNADIFAIHDLLAANLAPAAGTVFALALLLSGVSAGIVCTLAGQMVSEGALNWRLTPWVRRLVTRSISITPSIIIAGAVGRSGLDTALIASQVVLSVVLPFVTAPLIWFTCLDRYMTVRTGRARYGVPMRGCGGRPTGAAEDGEESTGRGANDDNGVVKMSNSWWVAALAVLIWLVIAAMNIANIVMLAMGE